MKEYRVINPVVNQWCIADSAKFRLADHQTSMSDVPESDYLKIEMKALNDRLYLAQRKLWADNRFSVLCVFQAMDAAGKDSTIREVFTGVNPAGVRVVSFKKPSDIELEHDFLWRCNLENPTAGTIGIFNRSHYEELLVVRIHPQYLDKQHLTVDEYDEQFWQNRFESVCDMEKHLSRNGTLILKFFLNVSKEEQKIRFLSRLKDVEKQWKFSVNDLNERQYWDEYMCAYQDVIQRTSKPHAPWYVIPADDKKVMQWAVAQTILDSIEALPLEIPDIASQDEEKWQSYIDQLESE